jgi:hypothetical protein
MPMLEWDPQQRTLFAETARDIANVGGGAMMFGSFLSDRPFSLMTTGLVMFALIGVFIGVVTLLDTIAYRRRQRKAGKH